MRITVVCDVAQSFNEQLIIENRLESTNFSMKMDSDDYQLWIDKDSLDEVIEMLQEIRKNWNLTKESVELIKKEVSEL